VLPTVLFVRAMSRYAIAAVVVVASLFVAASANADRQAVASNAAAPWAGGAAVVTPLEGARWEDRVTDR
jgi:hypothetical protein